VTFETVGKVKAKGAGKYSFIDNTILNGVVYYRLEVVDKNGSKTYSEIKELSIINYPLSITPNPAKDYISISGVNIKEFRINDASGRVLIVGKEKRVDVRGLAAGIYYITIQTIDGARIVQKLVKL
ncbi:MAG: T9SS type A sorting domain-containing protein, partial [Bacteroidota bacterium]